MVKLVGYLRKMLDHELVLVPVAAAVNIPLHLLVRLLLLLLE